MIKESLDSLQIKQGLWSTNCHRRQPRLCARLRLEQVM